jgi:hypothetical protein
LDEQGDGDVSDISTFFAASSAADLIHKIPISGLTVHIPDVMRIKDGESSKV